MDTPKSKINRFFFFFFCTIMEQKKNGSLWLAATGINESAIWNWQTVMLFVNITPQNQKAFNKYMKEHVPTKKEVCAGERKLTLPYRYLQPVLLAGLPLYLRLPKNKLVLRNLFSKMPYFTFSKQRNKSPYTIIKPDCFMGFQLK